MTARQHTGAAIKALRLAAGMTLDDLSEAAGVSQSYLSRAENDLVTPTAGWIELVAVAIGQRLVEQSSTTADLVAPAIDSNKAAS